MDRKDVSEKSHGLYTIPDAARIILATHPLPGVNGDFQWRLLHWVDAGVIQHGLFEDTTPGKYTTFEALVSMRIVFMLWIRGVSLRVIQRAEKRLIDELGVPWPFASEALWRRAASAFPRFASLIVESEHGPEAIRLLEGWLEENADDLEFNESGVAYAWRAAKNVLIHGGVVTGSPCIAGRRIPTKAIWDMLEGGDTIEGLMYGYDLTEDKVKDALAWEKRLAAVNL
jgi:uncharacterized protein (DUF433 family)